jgi:hypothetical protein
LLRGNAPRVESNKMPGRGNFDVAP